MALTKNGKHRYGDDHADLRDEIIRYSRVNDYPAEHFADAPCSCGSNLFHLRLDDNEGAAVRTCVSCGADHSIGDSDDHLEDAELEECACPCGSEQLQLTVGVALYPNSKDVRWLYLGCRCPACRVVAVYGDWKNEFEGYADLLARV